MSRFTPSRKQIENGTATVELCMLKTIDTLDKYRPNKEYKEYMVSLNKIKNAIKQGQNTFVHEELLYIIQHAIRKHESDNESYMDLSYDYAESQDYI
jgi:hypothetical protein